MKAPPSPKISRDDLKAIFESDPFPFFEDCGREFGHIFALDLGTLGNHDVKANGLCHYVWGPKYNRLLSELDYPLVEAGSARRLLTKDVQAAKSVFGTDGDFTDVLRPLFTHSNRETQETLLEYANSLTKSAGLLKQTLQSDDISSLIRPLFSSAMMKLGFDRSEPVVKGKEKDRLLLEELYHIFANEMNQDRSNYTAVRQAARILELSRDVVAARREARQSKSEHAIGHSVIDNLIRASEQSPELDDDWIAGSTAAFFYSSASLTTVICHWGIHWINQHPEVSDRLSNELHARFEKENGLETVAMNLSQMPYLRAVTQEVLRLSPCVLYQSPRITRAEINFDGYRIPPDSLLASSERLTHLDASVYENPREFLPERFLGTEPDPYAWIPFGFGSRSCPSVDTGFSMLCLSIACLHMNFEFEVNSFKPKPNVNPDIIPFAQPLNSQQLKWKTRQL